MTTSGLIALAVIGLIALRASSRAAQAGPAPTLNSVVSQTKLETMQQLESKQEPSVVSALVVSSDGSPVQTEPGQQKQKQKPLEADTTIANKLNGLNKMSAGKSSYGGPQAANEAAAQSQQQTTMALARSQQANVEKLRRGLANFMNNLNPAPFFVPQLQPPGARTKSSPPTAASGPLQAEPATIINDGPTADVLIKGPNRLVQSRPLGGPQRWGRR